MGSVAESTADKHASWWTSYIQLIYEMEITAPAERSSTTVEGSGFPAPDSRNTESFRAP